MAIGCPACGEQNPERARFCLGCGLPLPKRRDASPVVRRTVTVLFCDLVGSTALGERLDPESTREILSRYFQRTRAALEAHGGTVEKFIGDAVMAVFGLPIRHEDDAVRAARAAVAIKASLEELNAELSREWGVRLEQRIGIHSGEVAGDPSAGVQALVTGDPVNAAARLQHAAQPGEIVISAASHALMRERVVADPLGPVGLRGKESAIEAMRLVRLASAADVFETRRTAFVGREPELEELNAALATVIQESRCLMRVIDGPPGIGKSRLVSEFASELGSAARIVRGECPAYGAGITYWPIAEIIRSVAGIQADDRPEAAVRKLEALPAVSRGGEVLAPTLAAVIGLETASPAQPEIARAIRYFLEGLAKQAPTVMAIEDIHWAEPSLLDLLEFLERRAEASLLIVCSARPELLARRPAWGRDGRVIALKPLAKGETGRLLERLARDATPSASVRDRITNTADGNPLFAEQLLAMLIDRQLIAIRDGRWEATATFAALPLPPTIEALLASRLERLETAERSVLERAAVIGQVIPRHLLRAIVPADLRRGLPRLVEALMRGAYLRANAPGRDEELEFAHILVRDAVYAGLSKGERHQLHELVADRLEANAGQRLIEIQEVIGYHLEQAHRYRRELRPADTEAERLADRAASHLTAAGQRAFGRGDMSAGGNLLGRAIALLPADAARRVALLPSFGKALIEVGELPRARSVLDEAIARGRDLGHDQAVAYARIHRAVLRIWSEESAIDENRERTEIDSALAAFERSQDQRGLAQAWSLMAELEWSLGKQAPAYEAIQRAVKHAELAGDEWLRAEYLALSFSDPAMAPNLDTAARTCERVLDAAPGNHVVAARILPMLGLIRAAQGEADTARRLCRQGLDHCRELGLRIWEGEMSALAGWAELLSGDPEAAERVLVEGQAVLEQMGDRMHLSFLAALLARAQEAQDRTDEALASLRLSQATSTTAVDATWQAVQARILARRGDAEALDMATQAAKNVRPMGDWYYADALVDLAEVHVRLGTPDAARSPLRRAQAIYRRMGHVAGQRSVAVVRSRSRP